LKYKFTEQESENGMKTSKPRKPAKTKKLGMPKLTPEEQLAKMHDKAVEYKLESFKELNLKVGDMIGLKYWSKTMGMLLSEPYRKQNYHSYEYYASVQFLHKDGQKYAAVEEVPIIYVKKFHPWPYFYKEKPPKKVKESVESSSESVV